MAESVSVLLVSIAAVLTAIDQISIVLTTKKLWKQQQQLPDTESLESVWDDLPALAPPLIENVLRQGHKMLIAGPSKAGKSFALIELCIAIAEGRKWESDH